MSNKPVLRKYSRTSTKRNQLLKARSNLALSDMFERFISFKEIEGLSKRTLSDYHQHFAYLMEYLEDEIKASQINLDLFRGYIGFMLHEKDVSSYSEC
ncbi:hypothetical protein RYX56_06155 [Alkalihalophilus lindianensis]|uniref:Phage integrase, N-terminal SAM-like domain n=1 Tax=Alkalihalophilus lindianensis TaxID=1630542 RepID=A0ABU3X8J9_9BACI|nr:hypothetical protein [Alkalihalophilus lindianensis]MDV2683957.1 hypothetical protein [Alkalihalophilus lindianensis]